MQNIIALDIERFSNFIQIGLKDFNNKSYISFDIRNNEMFNNTQINDIKEILSDEKNTIITYNGMSYDNHMLAYLLSRPNSTANMLNDYTKLIIEGIKDLDKDNRCNKIAISTFLSINYTTLSKKEINDISNLYIRKDNLTYDTLKVYTLNKILNIKSYPYPTVDLFKIVGKGGLKTHGAILMQNIQELPYNSNVKLSDSQIDNIIAYNENDLDITLAIYHKVKKEIDLRDKLNTLYKVNTSNAYNDYRNKGNANLGLALLQEKVRIGKNRVVAGKFTFKLDLPSYLKFKNPKLQEILKVLKSHIFKLDKSNKLNISDILKD